MANERLRNALRSNNHTERTFAEDLGVDPKTVQRWITTGRVPHQSTAQRAAKLLDVPMSWLWPDLERPQAAGASAEVVGFYPHRSESPKQLWSDLLLSTHERLDLVAFASLFLPEENPESIEIIKYKASKGVKVRIALGEPGTPELKLRAEKNGYSTPSTDASGWLLPTTVPWSASRVSTFTFTPRRSTTLSFASMIKC